MIKKRISLDGNIPRMRFLILNQLIISNFTILWTLLTLLINFGNPYGRLRFPINIECFFGIVLMRFYQWQEIFIKSSMKLVQTVPDVFRIWSLIFIFLGIVLNRVFYELLFFKGFGTRISLIFALFIICSGKIGSDSTFLVL